MKRDVYTTSKFQLVLLGGVLSTHSQKHSSKRLSYIMSQLNEVHFDSECFILYKILLQYFVITSAVIPYNHFQDLLDNLILDDEKRGKCLALFIELQNSDAIEEVEFRYNAMRLRDSTKSDMLISALSKSMSILTEGARVGSKMHKGYESAVSTLNSNLAEISSMDDAGPSVVYLNREITGVVSEYSQKKYGHKSMGYPTGFRVIDESTSGGFQPGDLVLLAGYTSAGKSSLLYTLVDNWVYNKKINVVLGTAEHTPIAVQRRLVAIRSADSRYASSGAINYKKLKEGTLNSDQERQLEKVVKDMKSSDCGRIAVFKIPANSTVTHVFRILKSINQVFRVDLFAWDYLNYSTTEVKRNTDREEGTHIVRQAKVEATNFDGRGIPVVSPFQVARHRWETATKEGRYTLACLAETSEAEKASDVVWSMLDYEDRFVSQLLKNRDGPKYLTPFDIKFDYNAMRIIPVGSNL